MHLCDIWVFLKCSFLFCLLLQHVKIKIFFSIEKPFKSHWCCPVVVFVQEFVQRFSVNLDLLGCLCEVSLCFRFPSLTRHFWSVSVDLIARRSWEVLLFWAASESQLSPWFGINFVQNEHQPVAKSNGSWSQWDFLCWLWLTLDPAFWQRGRQCDRNSAWSLHAHLWNCLRQTFFLSYFSSITSFHREKVPMHVLSPKYTKLRDWHHEVSARVLNVQWFYPSCKSKIQTLPSFLLFHLLCKKKKKEKNEKRKRISVAFLREKF